MTNGLQGRLFDLAASARSIERRAWACLEQCRERLKIDCMPIPVPVERCIEGGLGIAFGVCDLSHLGHDVLGAAFIEDREIQIDEKVLENEGRFRFTCAHELGHMILHNEKRHILRDQERSALERDSAQERQADQFAASFLMPIPIFEQGLLRICEDRNLQYMDVLPDIMVESPSSDQLWTGLFLPEITLRFAVSLSAALIRCCELRVSIHRFEPLLPRPRMKRLWSMMANTQRNNASVSTKAKDSNQLMLFD